jgi:excisionase family DNA binding protein
MKLLKSEDVQGRLGISRSTLYLWVREAKLHPVRAGRALLFNEDEIMELLGRGTILAIWMAPGVTPEARNLVRQWIRTGARPHVLVQYLNPPTRDFIRCRVIGTGSGQAIEHPAPGGMIFDSLVEAKRTGKVMFLGSEESGWGIHDVRPETSPSGEPYIALELVPAKDGEGASSEREDRLRGILDRMKKGVIEGKVESFQREDLHARGAR